MYRKRNVLFLFRFQVSNLLNAYDHLIVDCWNKNILEFTIFISRRTLFIHQLLFYFWTKTLKCINQSLPSLPSLIKFTCHEIFFSHQTNQEKTFQQQQQEEENGCTIQISHQWQWILNWTLWKKNLFQP